MHSPHTPPASCSVLSSILMALIVMTLSSSFLTDAGTSLYALVRVSRRKSSAVLVPRRQEKVYLARHTAHSGCLSPRGAPPTPAPACSGMCISTWEEGGGLLATPTQYLPDTGTFIQHKDFFRTVVHQQQFHWRRKHGQLCTTGGPSPRFCTRLPLQQ